MLLFPLGGDDLALEHAGMKAGMGSYEGRRLFMALRGIRQQANQQHHLNHFDDPFDTNPTTLMMGPKIGLAAFNGKPALT
jgi:hypothetical protein